MAKARIDSAGLNSRYEIGFGFVRFAFIAAATDYNCAVRFAARLMKRNENGASATMAAFGFQTVEAPT